MSKKKAYVKDGNFYGPDGAFICAVPTSKGEPEPAWEDWLTDPENRAFRFIGHNISFLVFREDRVQRSGNETSYWYGHFRTNGRLRHFSCGSVRYARRITIRKLNRIANKFAAMQLADDLDREARKDWQPRPKARRSGDPPRRIMPAEPQPQPVQASLGLEPIEKPRGYYDD